jgi:hypothetical protein
MMWLRQMAQLSTTISAGEQRGQTAGQIGSIFQSTGGKSSQGWKDESDCVPHAQSATAFHFLISKRLLGLREDEEDGPAAEEPSPAGAGGGGALMSVSMADMALGLGSLRFDWGAMGLDQNQPRRGFVCAISSEARGFMEKVEAMPSHTMTLQCRHIVFLLYLFFGNN